MLPLLRWHAARFLLLAAFEQMLCFRVRFCRSWTNTPVRQRAERRACRLAWPWRLRWGRWARDGPARPGPHVATAAADDVVLMALVARTPVSVFAGGYTCAADMKSCAGDCGGYCGYCGWGRGNGIKRIPASRAVVELQITNASAYKEALPAYTSVKNSPGCTQVGLRAGTLNAAQQLLLHLRRHVNTCTRARARHRCTARLPPAAAPTLGVRAGGHVCAFRVRGWCAIHAYKLTQASFTERSAHRTLCVQHGALVVTADECAHAWKELSGKTTKTEASKCAAPHRLPPGPGVVAYNAGRRPHPANSPTHTTTAPCTHLHTAARMRMRGLTILLLAGPSRQLYLRLRMLGRATPRSPSLCSVSRRLFAPKKYNCLRVASLRFARWGRGATTLPAASSLRAQNCCSTGTSSRAARARHRT